VDLARAVHNPFVRVRPMRATQHGELKALLKKGRVNNLVVDERIITGTPAAEGPEPGAHP
jgi:hypothetical protein